MPDDASRHTMHFYLSTFIQSSNFAPFLGLARPHFPGWSQRLPIPFEHFWSLEPIHNSAQLSDLFQAQKLWCTFSASTCACKKGFPLILTVGIELHKHTHTLLCNCGLTLSAEINRDPQMHRSCMCSRQHTEFEITQVIMTPVHIG